MLALKSLSIYWKLDCDDNDDDDDSRVCATVGCLSLFNYHFYRNLIAFPCFPLPVQYFLEHNPLCFSTGT